MKAGFLSHRGPASHLAIGALLFCGTMLAASFASADTPRPVKLAIFDFELEDFSAGAQVTGESPADSGPIEAHHRRGAPVDRAIGAL